MQRILLAEDHLMVRQGLRSLLEREGHTVVAEAADGHEAVKLAETHQPEIAVVDLAMPLLNGLLATRGILRASPKTRAIVLTMFTEDPYVIEALQAGVRGYLLKTQAASELLQAIEDVAHGAVYLSPGISRAVVEAYLAKTDLPPDPLTSREREVLQLVAEGNTTRKVAAILGISVKTAESHRTRIMEKLDIHETAGLVRYAIRRRLIQP